MKTVKIPEDYKGMVTLAKKDGLGLLILIFKNNLILKYFFLGTQAQKIKWQKNKDANLQAPVNQLYRNLLVCFTGGNLTLQINLLYTTSWYF